MWGLSLKRAVWVVTLLTALSAFCTYSCMYAFRKAFTAATFGALHYCGVHYKVWLVMAQTLGYAASKFYGIRFISGLNTARRGRLLLGLIGVAWLALLGVAVVPAPYNVVFMGLNGVPLGMVFGVVFSYLEGRRSTELLGAVLAASFIFSSGLVKSVGRYLLVEWGVSDTTMPFVAGAVFVAPTLLSVWLLGLTPAPDEADVAARSRRAPMSGRERRLFVGRFGPGLALLVLCYVLLTTVRDLRDNFAADVWLELGYGRVPDIFVRTEIPVALAVLAVMGLLVTIRRNDVALNVQFVLIGLGLGVSAVATLLFRAGDISPPVWFTGIGLGLYMSYVPFNGLLFERLVACFRVAANVGFVMYIADAFGYLGSVGVLLVKELARWEVSWLRLLMAATVGCAVVGSVALLGAWWFFGREYRRSSKVSDA